MRVYSILAKMMWIMKIKIICNINILYILSFFGAIHPNMKYMLCKYLFFISTSRIQVVRGEKKYTTARTCNGEEDNVSKLLYVFSFFDVMQIIVHFFKFWNPSGKRGKNLQLLEQVNGEEDNISKLLLPNILFTIFIATINPMKHTLGIFHSVENFFMYKVY